MGKPKRIRKAGIYKIAAPNGAVYIGQSHDILRRFNGIKNNSSHLRKLNLSISKYGWESHVKEIAHELPRGIKQWILDTYEKLYIKCYKDCGIELLNIREGGKNGKNAKETRRLISKKAMGHAWTAKKIICSKTGIIYHGSKEASFAIGMSRGALLAQLSGQNKNTTTLKYLIQ